MVESRSLDKRKLNFMEGSFSASPSLKTSQESVVFFLMRSNTRRCTTSIDLDRPLHFRREEYSREVTSERVETNVLEESLGLPSVFLRRVTFVTFLHSICNKNLIKSKINFNLSMFKLRGGNYSQGWMELLLKSGLEEVIKKTKRF